MALSPGTRLGSYEILGPLGAGGMGEVYRATDSTLGRDVAIKVLPAEVTQDPQRLERFQREAHLLASLNHPNIAAIYGLEEADGKPFLVLELVEGEDLKVRLERGAVPVDETLQIAKQIAEALEEAHEKGIVHRDLKPANVMLTPDGKAKVLDFGLAKAWTGDAVTGSSSDLSQSPTLAQSGTQAGVILGTAAYMSPEQARGRAVDRRTDIWAFGVVLFEMLAGRRLFKGETVSDVLASVMKDEPDWDRLPAATPAAVRKLLRRCLERDPRSRLQHMGDARLELDEALSGSPTEEGSTARKGLPRVAVATSLVVAILAGFLIGGLYQPWLSPTSDSATPASFSIRLPTDAPLALGRAVPSGFDMRLFDISRDGTRLVYVADRGSSTQLYLGTVGALGAEPLAGTQGAAHPFFSPDGEWVGYVSGGDVRKLSLSGGRPETVIQASGLVWGAAWGEDAFYFVDGMGGNVKRVAGTGGDPVEIGRASSMGFSTLWPVTALPGGRGILVTAGRRVPMSGDYRDIMVWSADSGEWRTVLQGAGHDARYTQSGHLVYARAGGLQAVPFDLDRLEVMGEPKPALDDLRVDTLWNYTQFAFSHSGTLVYARGGDAGVGVPTWIDGRGNADPIDMGSQLYGPFALSPDGQQLAITVAGPADQVEIFDLATGIGRRLTTEANNGWPIWSPDGERVVFSSTRSGSWGLYVQSADGSGDAAEVLQSESPVIPYSWSARGNLVFVGWGDSSKAAFLSVEAGQEALRMPYPQTSPEFGHRLSPDGRWIAYTSFRQGFPEVEVRPFPELEPEYKVSAQGGMEALWSLRGDKLLYRIRNQWLASDIVTEPKFSASRPQQLFKTAFIDTFDGASWDLAPDGRFLMIKPIADDSDPTELRIVLNWFEELKRLVPTD